MTRKTRHDMAHGRQADRNASTAPPSRNSNQGHPWGTQGRTKGDQRGLTTSPGCTYEWHRRNWKDGHRAPRSTGCLVVHATLTGRGRKKGTEFGKRFYSGKTTYHYFSHHGGETAHSKNVPCRPHATGTNQHRNKQNTCTQQICSDKEPTPNKPMERQLTRPRTNKTTAADTT